MSSAAAKNSDDRKTPTQKSMVISLFMIAADTTWRMFIPIIAGTALGVWADNTVTPKPFLTVVGMVVGIIISALLVRQQMNRKI